jgi:hypothetical protein
MVEPLRRTPPVTRRISDFEAAEIVRQNHERRIAEIAQFAPVVIRDIALPPATVVWIPHNLGRPVACALPSAPRTPDGVGVLVGLISEARGSIGGKGIDSSQFVVLFANNFGTTITVDLVVF